MFLMSKLVAPSILSADFANLEKEVKAIEEAGADWVHVDVMDAHFVPNLTIGAPVVKSLRPVTQLPLDVHLMITDPGKYIPDFAKAGADYITFHVESEGDPAMLISQIKECGVKAGITLRPGTELSEIEPFLKDVDLVLVMTVEPGFGGQSFMEDQVPKITRLKALREENGYSYLIEVDGGVNDKSRSQLNDVDVFVAGSFVFKQNYKEAIDFLKK
jgi:ribulose-phosphate 3-epimerase